MSQRRKIDLALASVLILGLLLYIIFPPKPEPSYNGIPLSQWITVLETPAGKAQKEEAIRHMGTNAIPYLLKWIDYRKDYWGHKLDQGSGLLLNRQLLPRSEREQRASYACNAFHILGKDAAGAIPELKFQAFEREPGNHLAMAALASLGEISLPTLLEALTNQHPSKRWQAAVAMRVMGTNAFPAVPALTAALKDPDSTIQKAAAEILLIIDPAALKRTTQK